MVSWIHEHALVLVWLEEIVIVSNPIDLWLSGEGLPVLDWAKRTRIAIGSARGLAYLHEDCKWQFTFIICDKQASFLIPVFSQAILGSSTGTSSQPTSFWMNLSKHRQNSSPSFFFLILHNNINKP